MVKKLPLFLQSRELVGSLFGVAVATMSPSWGQWLESPPLSLSLLLLAAVGSGLMVEASVAWAGHLMEIAVRRATRAGGVSLVVAGSFLLWEVGRNGGFLIFHAWLILLASLMPVLLVASIAGGLGAWRFRRQLNSPPPPLELAGIYRWPVLGLICAGFLTAALSPLIPQPVPEKISEIVPAPGTPERNAPPVAPPPPRVPFEYRTPPELTTSPAVAWRIKTVRQLASVDTARRAVFSGDQRFLAWVESDSSVVVYDLESEGVRRITGIPDSVQELSFSPDGDRLFMVMQGQPPRVGVGFLKNDRFVRLPQPKKHAVPIGRVSWWKEEEVVFLPNSGPTAVLNLNSLEMDETGFSPDELEHLTRDQTLALPSNSRWAFENASILTFAERPEVEGTSGWDWKSSPRIVLTDRERVSRRIFMQITPASGDVFFGVRDGSKLMQVRGGQLYVVYFETGPVPPLHWKITMPHGPEQMKDKELVRSTLEKGRLSLLMYPPLVNPLNDRIVGPDRERPKAILRVQRWEGTEAVVWIDAGSEPYSPNDIFADLHVPGNPPRLLATQLPHSWWVKVPEPLPDAADPKAIPLRKDYLKEMPEDGNAKSDPAINESPSPGNGNTPGVSGQDKDPALKTSGPTFNQLEKSVVTFVMNHHQAASQDRLIEMVNDYANRVDHFNNGVVGRDFIMKDEREYHQKYSYVRETVKGDPVVRVISGGKVEVTYVMVNEWQRLADKVTGGATFRVSLTLEAFPEGWKITRHRADKEN